MKKHTKFYSPINLGDTKLLSNDEWLNWRQHGPKWREPKSPEYLNCVIGGSDVASILNLSPWRSALDLYDSKIARTHKIMRSNNEDALITGHIFEPFVATQFKRKMESEGHTVELIEDYGFWQCGMFDTDNGKPVMEDGELKLLYPFACANIDFMTCVDGVKSILEIKTTSPYSNHLSLWKDGKCPVYYELQCRYYMMCKNIDTCYICCGWGYRMDDMAIIKIERDLDIEEAMMAEVTKFVTCVETKTPPSTDGIEGIKLFEYYKELYGVEEKKEKELYSIPPMYRDMLFEISTLDNNIKELKSKISSLEDERMRIFAPLEKEMLENGLLDGLLDIDIEAGFSVSASLTPSYKRGSFDTEKFKAEHEDLYNSLTSFDVNALKEKDEALYKSYLTPDKVDNSKPLKIKVKINQPKPKKKKG